MDYDDIIEQKFTNALSECLGIDKEIIEILDLKLENNYGNSNEDIFYGYYVEIPNWDDLDKAIQEQISGEIKNEIEWGKIIYISESEFGNTKADPFNWKSDSEFEYYCITHSTQREDVLFTLKELKSKIEESQDELIIKSLILCAFSITESFIQNIIYSYIFNIPADKNNMELQNILNKHKDLYCEKNRKIVYKTLTTKNLLDFPFLNPVRHCLAHNMTHTELLNNNNLVVETKHGKESFSVDKIMNELIKYVEKVDNNI